MKLFLKLVVVVTFGFLLVVIYDQQEILIESWESKSTQGESIYNKIKWFQFKDQDVWMMNQSHHGLKANDKDWDRIAIVIDKTKSPKEARFYQFEPGPLAWSEDIQTKPFRVSCFMCHSNGLRVIRPDPESKSIQLSFFDKLKISYWNFRIKNYGRVVESSEHKTADQIQNPPFRYRGTYENEQLKVKVCRRCHNDSINSGLSSLMRQHLPAIRFMLEKQLMPIGNIQLNPEDQKNLKIFLNGF